MAHNAAKQANIDETREHHDTRTERRPGQTWYTATSALDRAAAKGQKGAVPVKTGR